MKTVFKRLICFVLMVFMLVSALPISAVLAEESIDWDRIQEKYNLTDAQLEKAKEIADEYDLTQEQVNAIEDYWDSLDEEEQEALKESVANGTFDESAADDYAVAIGSAVMKKGIVTRQ